MGDSIVRIKGVVIPVDWDDEGKAIAVAISAWDETDYRINMDAKGESLLQCIHKEVEVEGNVQENGKGKTVSLIEIKLRETCGRQTTRQSDPV